MIILINVRWEVDARLWNIKSVNVKINHTHLNQTGFNKRVEEQMTPPRLTNWEQRKTCLL